MAKAVLGNLVQHLRLMVAASGTQDLTDCELLEHFVQHKDETAFTALVRRHGPLVLGVCRRVLHHDHDAEDAFQATFLVLARKAAALRWRASIRSWLYEVAQRIARKARAKIARRQGNEKHLDELTQPASSADRSGPQMRLVLDEELLRLPEKYRAPLLLCCVEGKTRDEAAEELGWTVGAVKGRLERGRELLRRRLTGRGVTLSAVLLATLLSQNATAASVPALLLVSTVKAGMQFAAGAVAAGTLSAQTLTLTEGVLQTMFVTKLKIATAVLMLVAVASTGAGLLTHQALAERPSGAKTEGADSTTLVAFADEKDRGKEKKDASEVTGTLKAVDAAAGTITIRESGDKKPPQRDFNLVREVKVVIDGKDAKLTDLKEGAIVSLKVSEASGDVIGIRAEGPTTGGVVKTIDAAANRITLVGGEEPDRTFAVAKDASIVLDANAAKLGDIKPGTRVTLKLSADQTAVLALTAGRGKDERGDKGRERPDVYGTLAALDPAKGTLKLTIKDEGQTFDRTFELAREVKALLGERVVDLADVKVGTRVALRLGDDRKTVVAIRLNVDGDRGEKGGREGPSARGVVKEVDAARSTITLTVPGDGGRNVDKTFDLDKEVRVLGGRDGTKLADVKPGMPVMLMLARDRRIVVAIRLNADGERERESPVVAGLLKTVDAAKNTVTVTVRREGEPADQTFELGKEVKVVLAGRDGGRLTDLKAGMRILLTLTPDRKAVIAIREIRGEDGEGRERGLLNGVVKSVDAAKNTITLGSERESKTLDVAKEATITVDGKPAKLADVKAGARVTLKLSEDRQTVLAITTAAREGDGRDRDNDEIE